MKYKVYLQGHATTSVEVDAVDYVSAHRAAIEAAPKVRYVKSWTPVSVSRIEGDVPRETSGDDDASAS
jgi:hypothetical protein